MRVLSGVNWCGLYQQRVEPRLVNHQCQLVDQNIDHLKPCISVSDYYSPGLLLRHSVLAKLREIGFRNHAARLVFCVAWTANASLLIQQCTCTLVSCRIQHQQITRYGSLPDLHSSYQSGWDGLTLSLSMRLNEWNKISEYIWLSVPTCVLKKSLKTRLSFDSA